MLTIPRRVGAGEAGVDLDTALFVVHVLGFAAFFWYGLYVLTRGDGGRVARLTGITALATAALFGFGSLLEALNTVSRENRLILDRAQWWSGVAPAALWLQLSFHLGGTWEIRSRQLIIQVAYGAAAVLIVLGTFTDLVRNYPSRGALDAVGPLYIVYIMFLLACAGLALANFLRLPSRDTTITRAVTRMLIAGAICFIGGVSAFALYEFQGTTWSQLPAWLLLLAGLGAVGGTVGIQSNLLLGTDVRRDFLYNATGLALLPAPYLGACAALVGLDDTRPRLLALVLTVLTTAGYTLYGQVGKWLDAAFFSPTVREERASARAYVEALATQPVGPNPELATLKSFDDAVRRAITHLSDPTKLATSPLLNLHVVARGIQEQQLEENRLNRAAVLKEMLIDLLTALKPAAGVGGVTGEAARFYNCLYFPYVRGIGRRRAPTVLRQLQERRGREGGAPSDTERVVNWLLQVDEDTFYKWQRRGSDTVAAALRERETAAGGVVPI